MLSYHRQWHSKADESGAGTSFGLILLVIGDIFHIHMLFKPYTIRVRDSQDEPPCSRIARTEPQRISGSRRLPEVCAATPCQLSRR